MQKVTLPNVRKLFKFDPGYVGFDADLAGADAQVVAWEAEDEDLKAAFRAGLDVHDKNAEDMWGSEYVKLPGNSKEGPKSVKRKQNKVAVHLTNYGGKERTLAISLGWTIREASDWQRRWLGLHPGIKDNFHRRVEESLRTNRTIRNRFGYHRIFFDRIETSFTEALAWIPQSTVAIASIEGALQLERSRYFLLPQYKDATEEELLKKQETDEQISYVEMLLQVHDSVVFQIPKAKVNHEEIIKGLTLAVPYDDPLTIPWGLSTSELSWGECKEVKLAA